MKKIRKYIADLFENDKFVNEVFYFFTEPSLRLLCFWVLFVFSGVFLFFEESAPFMGVVSFGFWDKFGFELVFFLLLFFPFSRFAYQLFCALLFFLVFVFFFSFLVVVSLLIDLGVTHL